MVMPETITWFYEEAKGQQAGPFTDVDFQKLRANGVILPTTRVWNASLPGWQKMHELDPRIVETEMCKECNKAFPADDLLKYGDTPICVGCKNTVVEKLQMGQQIGQGVWRDGNIVVAEKNSELPARCFKCNCTSAKSYSKRRVWLPKWASIPLLISFIFVRILFLVFLIVAFCVQKKGKVTVHLCQTHQEKRRTNLWLMVVSFVACPILLAFGVTLMGSENVIGTILLGASFLSFIGIFVFSFLSQSIGKTKIIKDELIHLKGAGEDFLETLPSWHGSL